MHGLRLKALYHSTTCYSVWIFNVLDLALASSAERKQAKYENMTHRMLIIY